MSEGEGVHGEDGDKGPAKRKMRKEPLRGISCSRCTMLASETRVTFAGGMTRPGRGVVVVAEGWMKRGDLAGWWEGDQLKGLGL